MSGGMRIGEVLGLEPEDIDLDTGVVHVRRSNRARETMKNQRERVTFLTDEALVVTGVAPVPGNLDEPGL